MHKPHKDRNTSMFARACVCVQTRSSLWGSTWMREGVPGHWAFNRKTFHRLSKNPNDFNSHEAGFCPPTLSTPAAIKPCMFGMQNMAPAIHITRRAANIAA